MEPLTGYQVLQEIESWPALPKPMVGQLLGKAPRDEEAAKQKKGV